jgi:hypothetical protein
LLTSINGGFATEFALVDLCVSPFAGSGSVTTRAANGAVSGVVTGTTGSLFAEITHGGTVTPVHADRLHLRSLLHRDDLHSGCLRRPLRRDVFPGFELLA